MIRRKLAARVAELEDAADQARNRANKLEKDKNRLQIEVRDLTVQLETVSRRLVTVSCIIVFHVSQLFLLFSATYFVSVHTLQT